MIMKLPITMIDKEQFEKVSDTYRFTIKEISRFRPAEIGTELLIRFTVKT